MKRITLLKSIFSAMIIIFILVFILVCKAHGGEIEIARNTPLIVAKHISQYSLNNYVQSTHYIQVELK